MPAQPMTFAECDARREKCAGQVYSAIYRKTPLWAFLLSVTLVIGSLGAIGATVIGNNQRIAISEERRVALSQNVAELKAGMQEVSKELQAVTRALNQLQMSLAPQGRSLVSPNKE